MKPSTSKRRLLGPVVLVLLVAAVGATRGGRSRPHYASTYDTYQPTTSEIGFGAFGPTGSLGGRPLEMGFGSPGPGGTFYANSNLGTAVSSDGDHGYIAVGGGQFVSW